MSPPVRGSKQPITAHYTQFIDFEKTKGWVGLVGWLTCSGRFTHISGHPSVAGRAQERESSPGKDRRSTTVPRHQIKQTQMSHWRLATSPRSVCDSWADKHDDHVCHWHPCIIQLQYSMLRGIVAGRILQSVDYNRRRAAVCWANAYRHYVTLVERIWHNVFRDFAAATPTYSRGAYATKTGPRNFFLFWKKQSTDNYMY